MKDEQIQNNLAKLMVAGTLISAAIIVAGLFWYLTANLGLRAGDHIFSGEPKYFESPVSMIERAFDVEEVGHRRSMIMLGVLLLLISPVVRVAFALCGFALQKDRMYAIISLIVLAVLLFSFFS